MADEDNSSTPSRPRRSSFAGQTFAGLFGNGRTRESRGSFGDNEASTSQPGPITTAAAQARNRRMSLTTLGLSTSPDTASRFGSYRTQRDSLASSPGSIDESAIEDDVGPRDSGGASFQRRASFGARAFMDVRNSTGGANGGAGQNGTKSPPAASFTRAPSGTISSRDAQGRGLSLPFQRSSQQRLDSFPSEVIADNIFTGEGFNWSENFRTRAERTSIAAASAGERPMINHGRAKSVAVMEPPVNEMPKSRPGPDHFQERILKGDFYMD